MNIICKKCNEEKDETQFYKTQSKTGFHHCCIACCKIRWKDYTANKECKRHPRGRKQYIEPLIKICTHCKIAKDISSFGIRSGRKNGRLSKCSECVTILHREWTKRNPNGSRNRNLKSKYGISEEDYNMLLRTQGGGCAICGIVVDPTHKQLSVDHCHTSGKVRGLLCTLCNTALGSFKDDPQLLQKAINYVSNMQRCRW